MGEPAAQAVSRFDAVHHRQEDGIIPDAGGDLLRDGVKGIIFDADQDVILHAEGRAVFRCGLGASDDMPEEVAV